MHISEVLSKAALVVGMLVAGSASASAGCATAPDGLVAWWRGDGNTLDAVGGFDAQIVDNVGYEPGKVGQAFVFDGVWGGGVDVGNPVALQLQNFTIELWFKRANPLMVTYGWPSSWGQQNAPLFACTWGGYVLGIYDTGELFVGKVGYSAVATTTLWVTDTEYHHVAVTLNGSDVVFYLDGVSEAVTYSGDRQFFDNWGGAAYPAAIGTRGSDYIGTFLGSIDEVSIYNRALTATEVERIYLAQDAGKCLGPSPTDQILALMDAVRSLNVAPSTSGSLSSKLSEAQAALGTGDIASTCDSLKAFINAIKAQTGKKKLTEEQANSLISQVTPIQTAIGCQ